jgi:hypothetical protein
MAQRAKSIRSQVREFGDYFLMLSDIMYDCLKKPFVHTSSKRQRIDAIFVTLMEQGTEIVELIAQLLPYLDRRKGPPNEQLISDLSVKLDELHMAMIEGIEQAEIIALGSVQKDDEAIVQTYYGFHDASDFICYLLFRTFRINAHLQGTTIRDQIAYEMSLDSDEDASLNEFIHEYGLLVGFVRFCGYKNKQMEGCPLQDLREMPTGGDIVALRSDGNTPRG